jgi:hypothetical protein
LLWAGDFPLLVFWLADPLLMAAALRVEDAIAPATPICFRKDRRENV